MLTVQRGLSNVKKLKKVEAEETIKADISRFKMPLMYSSSNINELLVSIVD